MSPRMVLSLSSDQSRVRSTTCAFRSERQRASQSCRPDVTHFIIAALCMKLEKSSVAQSAMIITSASAITFWRLLAIRSRRHIEMLSTREPEAVMMQRTS
jgi:hypothetical protein